MILNVEFCPPNNCQIRFDNDGYKDLMESIQYLENKVDHNHLWAPSFGGNDLTEMPPLQGCKLIYKLTFRNVGIQNEQLFLLEYHPEGSLDIIVNNETLKMLSETLNSLDNAGSVTMNLNDASDIPEPYIPIYSLHFIRHQ